MNRRPLASSDLREVSAPGLPPLSLALRRFAPGARVEPHTHAFATICLLAAGDFEERLEGSRSTLAGGAGTAVVMPAGCPHSNRFGARGAVILSLALEGEASAFVTASGVDLTSPTARRFDGSAALASRLLAELERPRPSTLTLYGVALATLGGLADVAAPSDRGAWLDRLRERLRDECVAPPPLSTLAADAGVHPAHLARAFRRRFGLSIGDALRRARAERAVELVVAGDAPLAEVALDCGFYDQSHLTRAIRRLTGLPPGRLRRQGQCRLG